MRFQLLIFFFAICVCFTAPVVGQNRVEKESEQGLSQLLRINGVAREIDLTVEQQDRLFGLWLEIKFDLEKAVRNYTENFSETLPANRKSELQQELVEAIEKIREKEVQRLEDALRDDQLKRLKQLRVQFLARKDAGIGALKGDLDLTETQVKKIRQISDAFKKELLEIQASQRVERLTKAEVVRIFKDTRKVFREDIKNVLTPAQRSKLNNLQGAAFDFSKGRRVNKTDSEADEANSEGGRDSGKQGNSNQDSGKSSGNG